MHSGPTTVQQGPWNAAQQMSLWCLSPRALRWQWAALLQDWALLGGTPPGLAAARATAFLPEPAAAVLPRVADAIDRAAPASLLALSASVASASVANASAKGTDLVRIHACQ